MPLDDIEHFSCFQSFDIEHRNLFSQFYTSFDVDTELLINAGNLEVPGVACRASDGVLISLRRLESDLAAD